MPGCQRFFLGYTCTKPGAQNNRNIRPDLNLHPGQSVAGQARHGHIGYHQIKPVGPEIKQLQRRFAAGPDNDILAQ